MKSDYAEIICALNEPSTDILESKNLVNASWFLPLGSCNFAAQPSSPSLVDHEAC